jgi:HAD superfamily hydrolase (TIGR01549 family)
MKIKAIALDAYGTICYIGKKSNPYRKLFERLNVDVKNASRMAMTQNCDLKTLAEILNHSAKIETSEIEQEIEREISSVKLFPEVYEVLLGLKKANIALALVSNLSPPYAKPILELLPNIFDSLVFSFEIGFIKPEKEIFSCLCTKLNCSPDEILMIGDSLSSDIKGANNFGINSLHINRKGVSFSSLDQLSYYLDF